MTHKIIHIADTHIRLIKYHQEYRIIFEEMYEKIRDLKPDFIIHTGDLLHNKISLSPESVELGSEFLKNLADIAKTFIILGNHDVIKNKLRQDAITPIVTSLNHPNLNLLKYSQEVAINDDINLNVLSFLDKEIWKSPTQKEKISIALFHGPIKGVTTDTGWIIDRGDMDLELLCKHDYAMLGDIHLTNQKIDENGFYRYAGSTIQQNFAESDNKGFLLWEIEDKKNFKCQHISIKNPKPFITVDLTDDGRLPDKLCVPPSARVRLVSNDHSLPYDAVKRVIDLTNSKFNPESVIYLNKSERKRNLNNSNISGFDLENLRDISVQENLIKDFLKNYKIDDETVQNVLDLNKKYNHYLEQNDDETIRNVRWELLSLEFDNLFNYGKGNKIDFEKLDGIVAIPGANFSGKSSLVETVLYTIFNTTSKNIRKNLDVINQTKNWCMGKVKTRIGDELYYIERRSDKYPHRLHNEETIKARTEVNFWKTDLDGNNEQSLNEQNRIETDYKIRKIFGEIEDFLLTSMMGQFGSLLFINEGSTKRKEILAKFLDLDIFEKKYRLAKEDVSDLRGVLKKNEGRNFDEEIRFTKSQIGTNKKQIDEQRGKCDEKKEEVSNLTEQLAILNNYLNNVPKKMLDNVDVLRNDLNRTEKEKEKHIESNKKLQEEINKKEEWIKKVDLFLSETFDIGAQRERKKEIREILSKIEKIEIDIEHRESNLEKENKRIKILDEVPCGEEYSDCKFIRDAYVSKKEIQKIQSDLRELKDKIESSEKEDRKRELEKIETYVKKYEDLNRDKINGLAQIGKYRLEIQNNVEAIQINERASEATKKKIEECENNKEEIEKFQLKTKEKMRAEDLFNFKKSELIECEKKILQLNKERGSFEHKLNDLVEEKKELYRLRKEYESYDLFLRCYNSGGIAFDIIRNCLPILNDEIAKILTNVTNFEVFIECEDNKLEILLKHPKYSKRSIENCSGAEKSLASMAIRIALIKISTLPLCNLFLLDEPVSELDHDNLDNFVRILDILKENFKTVLLISHMDVLRDIANSSLIIEKDHKGFAHIDC